MYMESLMTPSIQFEQLDGMIPDSQILKLRCMVANHSLQRQKLATAGSVLLNLWNNTQSLRASVESLTGWVHCVLSDTLQVIVEGDNIMSSLSKAFDELLEQAGIPTAGLCRTELLHKWQPISPHGVNPTGGISSVRGDTSNSPPDMRNTPTNFIPLVGSNAPADLSDSTHKDQRPYTLSPQMQAMMDWELPPQRDDETDEQYDGQYHAHLNCINNTQQSWTRSGYDAPPHLPPHGIQDKTPDNHAGVHEGVVLLGQPGYIPGMMHPDALQH
jgi:hypothetical protein